MGAPVAASVLSPPKRRQRPSQQADARIAQTEQIVFDAAVELVAELGPAAVTVEAIAGRSGVARSTIYRRWPDVDRLFVEVFKALTALRPIALTGRVAEDLRTFGHDYARDLDDPVFFGIVVFLFDASRDSKQFRALARSITRQRERRGAAIVRTAIARGELSTDADPLAVAGAVMAPLFHRRVGRHQMASSLDVDAAVVWALAVATPDR